MIIVTGAAGFIASHLIEALNRKGHKNIIAVDDFSSEERLSNLQNTQTQEHVHRDQLTDWLIKYASEVRFVFHLGARTDTTETDIQLLAKLNTEYSKTLWSTCAEYQIPLIYASSAATYGDGAHGFKDNEDNLIKLRPLNAYAESKHQFDLWAMNQDNRPPFWAGFKFFNVYGDREQHKGKMASMVYQARQQIQRTGQIKLFKSYLPQYDHGEQKRDFVWVEDVVKVLIWFSEKRPTNGIYNLGSGKAQSFNELATAVFRHLNRPISIEYIEMPAALRGRYQYFTEADMQRIQSVGYTEPFLVIDEVLLTDY